MCHRVYSNFMRRHEKFHGSLRDTSRLWGRKTLNQSGFEAVKRKHTSQSKWPLGISDNSWTFILTLVAALGVLTVVIAPNRGYNSRIYEEIVGYWNEFGQLPARDTVLGTESIPGSMADFPTISFFVYRGIFSSPEPTHELLWATWQILPALIVSIFVSRKGYKLNLDPLTSRILSILGVMVSIWVAIPWEDKSYLYWLPLGALLINAYSRVGGSISMGVLVGWTGLGPAAIGLPWAQMRPRPFKGFSLSVLSATLAGLTALIGGSLSVTLLTNRSILEANSEAQWYSIWQLFEPPPLFVRTSIIIVFGSLVLYSIWIKRSTATESLIAMLALSLLFSSN